MNAAWESLAGIQGGVSYDFRQTQKVLRALDNQWWNQSKELARLKQKAKLNPTDEINLEPRLTREVRWYQFPDFPEIRPGPPVVLPWRNSPEWFFHNLEPPKSK